MDSICADQGHGYNSGESHGISGSLRWIRIRISSSVVDPKVFFFEPRFRSDFNLDLVSGSGFGYGFGFGIRMVYEKYIVCELQII
jgi:hypothetical protein